MATDGDRSKDALKVRAWELATREKKPLRQVATELGISLASASRYVRQVEQAGEYIDLLDAADTRVGQAVRFRQYVDLLRARIEQGARPEQIIPQLMRVEDALAKLHGTSALPELPEGTDMTAVLNLGLLNELRAVQERAAQVRARNGAPPRDEYGEPA